eukprot:3784991-Prymnesium_polylepis.1
MRRRPDAAVQVNTTPRRRRSCANGATGRSVGAPGPAAAASDELLQCSDCWRMLWREVAPPSTVRQRRWRRGEAG